MKDQSSTIAMWACIILAHITEGWTAIFWTVLMIVNLLLMIYFGRQERKREEWVIEMIRRAGESERKGG